MNKDNQYLIITDDKFACVEVSDKKVVPLKYFLKKLFSSVRLKVFWYLSVTLLIKNNCCLESYFIWIERKYN